MPGTARLPLFVLAFLLGLGGARSGVAQDSRAPSPRPQVGGQRPSGTPVQSDPDREAVLRVVNLFYRDLATGQWNDVQNHFWPAKVAARWPAPFDEPKEIPAATPIRLSSSGRSAGAHEEGGCDSGPSSGRLALTFVGRWARVAERSCPPGTEAGTDPVGYAELWLLKFDGVWKIVYIR